MKTALRGFRFASDDEVEAVTVPSHLEENTLLSADTQYSSCLDGTRASKSGETIEYVFSSSASI
jgi:hypothetical protein